jgi:predicted nucleic acid-binding protein
MRIQQVGLKEYAEARKLAEIVSNSWAVIQPSNALRAAATQLVDRYDLRAADSLQLAAALEWCERIPKGRIFLTADARLRESALISGFDVMPL